MSPPPRLADPLEGYREALKTALSRRSAKSLNGAAWAPWRRPCRTHRSASRGGRILARRCPSQERRAPGPGHEGLLDPRRPSQRDRHHLPSPAAIEDQQVGPYRPINLAAAMSPTVKRPTRDVASAV